MGSNLLTTAVRETEAALRGLAASLDRVPRSPELLLHPLARIGDALRLSIDIPQQVRRWAEKISDADLTKALGAAIEETRSWNFPERPIAKDDPWLASVVSRRDELESVVRAVYRIAVPNRPSVMQLPEFAALESILALDNRFAALLTREDVVRLLETRAGIGPTWADAFPRDEVAPIEGEDDARWAEAIRGTPPSDESVTRYVTSGVLRRYVEGVAEANTEFASELAECIDALLEARENVALVARGWRKRHSAASARDPLELSVLPSLQFAAATKPETKVVKTVVHLGALSPLDAEASLEVSAREVTLHVFAGENALRRIELGDKATEEPSEPGRWQLVVPVPSVVIRLRVIAASGAEFAEELRLAPADADDDAR